MTRLRISKTKGRMEQNKISNKGEKKNHLLAVLKLLLTSYKDGELKHAVNVHIKNTTPGE